MKKLVFIFITSFAFSKVSFAALTCAQYLGHGSEKSIPSIESLFDSGEKVVHVVFSTPADRFNIIVKRITDAWVFHGYSINKMEFAISKTIVLADKVLVFTKVNHEMYKNIILSTHPEILELAQGYVVSKGFKEHVSKATPDLMQVFSHIEENENVLIPATILFPIDSHGKIDVPEVLHAIGITDFNNVGESVFANITKRQYDTLSALPEVEQIGLQF